MEDMWLLEAHLRELGFKRKSERYWQCENRYGLPSNAHFSLFPWSESSLSGGQILVELTEFHITFAYGRKNIRFYYRRCSVEIWTPGFHSCFRKMQRLVDDPAALVRKADAVARTFIEALGGMLSERASLVEPEIDQ